jgi:retron-type reverse transcriptase
MESRRKISPILFSIYLSESLNKIRRTLSDNLEMISTYADDIAIIFKPIGNLNRVIKMVETEFGKLNFKI